MWVIAETSGVEGEYFGYAVNNPIEGWVMTVLRQDATKFSSLADATIIWQRQYWSDPRYAIIPA